MAYDENALNELSAKLGIMDSFRDPCTGIVYKADKKSKQVICRALGYRAGTNAEVSASLNRLQNQRFLTIVPSTIIAYENETQPLIFEMSLPCAFQDEQLTFTIEYENGSTTDGSFWFHDMPLIEEGEVNGTHFQRRRIYLFMNVSLGYHHLIFKVSPELTAKSFLIVAPEACYVPAFTNEQKRVFGFPLQLYALRSDTNWGIGDFTDLTRMVSVGEELGASLIGVNPLSALFADTPCDASPYCASSRLFLNPLYVDIDRIPEAAISTAYANLKQSTAFQTALKEARENPIVQYEIIAELKYKSFKVLHDIFKITHFDENKIAKTGRGKKFVAFKRSKGKTLTIFATYHALRQHFLAAGKSAIWWQWDEAYQHPDSEAVKQFQSLHADEIEQFEYQQFVAFEQYEQMIKAFAQSDMPLGLYTDLPVGVGDNSAEVWGDRSVFMPFVTTGAPPDMFNKKGQDWSLAPFNPYRLEQVGFEPYRRVIETAMHGAGAVRLDHAFGLERLYLRVKGASGAYLKYPYKALMGIVALESHRNKCLVIAEDLGTAPDGFGDKMRAAKALSFKIAHYQQCDGALMSPERYDYMSLIATGTHDLPSYTAFWKGMDLELGRQLKTITAAQYKTHLENRRTDRETFVETFYRQSLPMPNRENLMYKTQEVPEWFVSNTYLFLSRTTCLLLLVRFEDLLGQDEQINLPGTYLEYPNWRYKLPVPIEKLQSNVVVESICRMIELERPPFKKDKGDA